MFSTLGIHTRSTVNDLVTLTHASFQNLKDNRIGPIASGDVIGSLLNSSLDPNVQSSIKSLPVMYTASLNIFAESKVLKTYIQAIIVNKHKINK